LSASRKCITPLIAVLICCSLCEVSAQDRDVRTLANTFADALSKSSRRTVAVVDFTDLQGNVTELGRYLAEQLSVALATTDKRLDVVDRTHLKVLLQENKLSSSGIIDQATARKLGQIAGVEILITGTLTPFGDSVQVAVKALDTTTARIVTAATADIAKTKAIEELLSRGVAGGSSTFYGGSGGASTPSTTLPLQKQTVKGLELELTVCRHRGDKMICELRVKNLLEDHEYMLLGQAYETPTRAVDDSGNMYAASQVQMGDQAGNQFAKTILPSGVSVMIRVAFFGVPAEVQRLSLLEIRFTDDWNNRPGGAKFQLRAIPVN